MEDIDPQQRCGNAGHHGGQIEHRAKEGHSPHLLVQQQGQQKRGHDSEKHTPHAKIERVLEAGVEERILEHLLVIRQSYPAGAIKQRPVGEADEGRGDDRPSTKQDETDQPG